MPRQRKKSAATAPADAKASPPVSRRKLSVEGPSQDLFGVNDFDGPFLKFDCIAPGRDRHINQLPGNVNVAVVVDTDFGNNVARISFSNDSVSDLHLTHCDYSPCNMWPSTQFQ